MFVKGWVRILSWRKKIDFLCEFDNETVSADLPSEVIILLEFKVLLLFSNKSPSELQRVSNQVQTAESVL
jgi:hypothetical protein